MPVAPDLVLDVVKGTVIWAGRDACDWVTDTWRRRAAAERRGGANTRGQIHSLQEKVTDEAAESRWRWKGKRKRPELAGEGCRSPARYRGRVLRLSIISTGITDCNKCSGASCSERRELLPSFSRPEARHDPGLTPTRGRRDGAWKHLDTSTSQVSSSLYLSLPIGGLMFTEPSSIYSLLLALSSCKGHFSPPPPPPSPSAKKNKSLFSLDTIDIQAKCQSSSGSFWLSLSPLTFPSSITSGSGGMIVSGDRWRTEPLRPRRVLKAWRGSLHPSWSVVNRCSSEGLSTPQIDVLKMRCVSPVGLKSCQFPLSCCQRAIFGWSVP